MRFKILHLSDLHFKAIDITQDLVITSLMKALKELFDDPESRPNILVVTGDIAFSGKKEEYTRAKTFIDQLLELFRINKANVFFIPGNHDVDRDKIGKGELNWWYNFKTQESLMEILSTELSLTKILSKIQAYNDFVRPYFHGNIQIGKYGEYVKDLSPAEDQVRVKIVGLNSAIFCGYDGDDERKLALGIEQVSNCDTYLNSKCDLVITCVHHPLHCFNACEKTTLQIMKRFSDILLSGHEHEESNSLTQDGNTGQTMYISAGAGYDKREHENSFNTVEIDTETYKGKVKYFKYLPHEHVWILNKDINYATNGVFEFDFPKLISIKQNLEAGKQVASEVMAEGGLYEFAFQFDYDKLDRVQFQKLVDGIKEITNDQSVKIIRIERGSTIIYVRTSVSLGKEFTEHVSQDNFMKVKVRSVLDSETMKVDQVDNSVYHWRTFLKPEFHDKMVNPGANFIHSRVEELKLNDLFVPPSLQKIQIEKLQTRFEQINSSVDVLTKVTGQELKMVIYGQEYSGKSTLLRWAYSSFYNKGFIPVFLMGNTIKDITIEKLEKLVQREFLSQYEGAYKDKFNEFVKDRIILLIDDFHKIRISKPKLRANIIRNFERLFSNIVICASDIMQFESYAVKGGGSYNIMEHFQKYQILEFGPTLRYEVIRKWNGLGAVDLDANELIRINNQTETYIDSIIGKNFVPSFPIYLLTILQAKESSNIQKPEYSLHGFYYELLINESLNKSISNKEEISLYYNYITDYCYFLFKEKLRLEPLHLSSVASFHNNYCKEYNIRINEKVVLDTLEYSKLIRISDDFVSITYNYIYYFFTAKYLANNINESSVKEQIQQLCQRVYREEYASIVLFLTHLSKDQFVIDQLLQNSKALFIEFEPAKLEQDVDFINQMVTRLPDQVYEPVDVEEVKREELRDLDELDQEEKKFDSKKDVVDYDLNEDISALDVFFKFTKAIKTIEILGQVTKKYWGSLKAPQKFELAEETYLLGLRSLGFYFSILEKDSDILVDYLNQIYRKKYSHKVLTKELVTRVSQTFIFNISVAASFGVIKRIANAIGYEKLAGTFEEILNYHDFNAVRLIDTSIKLDHNRSFPWKDIEILNEKNESHFLSKKVLQKLVLNYLYVFYTSIEDKQKICSLLGIEIDKQRLIDATSVVKKE